MEPNAKGLREIANLIDVGVPAPLSVMLTSLCEEDAPQLRVHIAKSDLGNWITALGIGEPSWHGNAEDGMMFARWPEGTWDERPFRLICVDTSNMPVVEAQP